MLGRHKFKKARDYAQLGCSLLAGSQLWLLGLLAPDSDNDLRGRWTRRLLARLRVRPERLLGLRLEICPTDWSETIVFEEIFLKTGYDLDLLSFRPTEVFDCGGHIGMFSLLANSHYPDAKFRIYEPNPSNFQRILRNMHLNDLTWECITGAVATCDGEADLNIVNSHGASISEILGPTAKTVHVRTYGLAAAIQKLAPKRLLLKLDVEGEEKVIWPGLIPCLPATCAIFFETHHGVEGWELAAKHLKSAGFALKNLSARGKYCDGFAERNEDRISTVEALRAKKEISSI
jgi:FkbM family methyltransferase